MRKAVTTTGLLLALALAGCSGGDGGAKFEAVTCPDGTVLSAEEVELAMEGRPAVAQGGEPGDGNRTEGVAAQVCPVLPSVTLEGVPAALQAFKQAPFRWNVDNGSVPGGHSVLTAIRYSTESVPAGDLTGMAAYPNELIKREHQALPVGFTGNLSFSKPGTIYLRAYAQVQGTGYEKREFWSPESALEVTPVPPTGTVLTVVKGPGDFLSPPTPPTTNAVLGDAIELDNQDPVPRTCSFQSGPAQVEPLTAEGSATSNQVLLLVPGTYAFTCNTAQPTGFSVNVAVA